MVSVRGYIIGYRCALRDDPSGIAAEGTIFPGMQREGNRRGQGQLEGRWRGSAKRRLTLCPVTTSARKVHQRPCLIRARERVPEYVVCDALTSATMRCPNIALITIRGLFLSRGLSRVVDGLFSRLS